MQFWRTCVGSCTDLATYHTALRAPLRSSFWFFIRFYLLLAFGAMMLAGTFGWYSGKKLGEQLPVNAVFTFEKETLSARDAQLPLSLTLPLGIQANIRTDSVEVRFPQKEPVTLPYRELIATSQTFTVHASAVRDEASKSMMIAGIIAGVFAVGITVAGRLFSAVFHSVFFSWILGLWGQRVVFPKMLQLSLHATIPAELITLIGLLIYRGAPSFPLFEVAFVGVMFLVLQSLRRPSA